MSLGRALNFLAASLRSNTGIFKIKLALPAKDEIF